jgi:hypothetical protein
VAGIARRCQRQGVTIDVGIVRYKNGTRHGQWMVLERRESVMDTIATLAEGKTAINTQVAIGEFAACRKGARLDEETQSLRGAR